MVRHEEQFCFGIMMMLKYQVVCKKSLDINVYSRSNKIYRIKNLIFLVEIHRGRSLNFREFFQIIS